VAVVVVVGVTCIIVGVVVLLLSLIAFEFYVLKDPKQNTKTSHLQHTECSYFDTSRGIYPVIVCMSLNFSMTAQLDLMIAQPHNDKKPSLKEVLHGI
jgi:hypothetical protein